MALSGRFIFTNLSLYALVVTLGCSSTSVPTIERNHFRETAWVSELKKDPFHHAWYDHTVDWEDFKGMYVTPVNYASLREQTWWNTVSFKQDSEEAVIEVARYVQHAIKKALADNPTHKLQVVNEPGPDTVVIDLALVELVPTKAWSHSLGSISSQSMMHESVAVEVRVREGETGRVIAVLMDRQVGKQELVNMTEAAWSSHIHSIADDWANQIATFLNSLKEEKQQPFINHYVKSIGAAFADMFSKLGAAPRLGLQSP